MRLLEMALIVVTLTSAVNCLSFMVTSKIYMDVKQNKKPLGRIVFGLFGAIAPKTAENFRHICLRGINDKTYIGSTFHRVIDRFLIQGGDIEKGDGTGSASIYGKYFDDEQVDVSHNRRGYLGMANRGPNTNGCQFYVTTASAKWLDGKHTIFGKVLEGMDVVHAIERVKTDTEDFPLDPVVITNCGEMPTEPYEYYPDEFSLWGWIIAAGPPVLLSLGVLGIFHYFFRQLDKYC